MQKTKKTEETKLKKVTIALLIIALLATLCFACLAACNKTDGNVIRLSEVTHSLFYTPQYLALSLGYFEEEGLKVEVTNGSGDDNVMTALLTDEADIGSAPVVYFIKHGSVFISFIGREHILLVK